MSLLYHIFSLFHLCGFAIGYGNTLAFAFAIVSAPICGYLVNFGWNAAFLLNLIALPVGIMCLLFLKEPSRDEENTPSPEATEQQTKVKAKFSAWIWIFAIIQALMSGTAWPYIAGMSTQFAFYKIGTAALAGIFISVFSIGATCGGLFITPFQKIFKHHSLYASMFLMASMMVIAAFFHTIVVMAIATFLIGVSYSLCMIGLQVMISQIAKPSQMAFASTLLVAAIMLGVYISSYWIIGCHAVFNFATDIDSANFGCGILWAAMALLIVFSSKSIKKINTQG